jgi:glutamate racemase
MGGLTVRAEIARALPHESLVYFGDGANVPYGPRPKEEIIALVDSAIARLIDRNVKMVVVACNAATGAAIDHLRAKYDVPIVGMEPAVKPAALTTRTGVVGVLATIAAFKGELYRATAARFRKTVRIIETVGEGFVELVENDQEESPQALEIVRRAVEPLLEAGADRIVLGCTHYPYLEPQIRRVIEKWSGRPEGRSEFETTERESAKSSCKNVIEYDKSSKIGATDVHIVDSAPAIARRVEQLLTEHDLHAEPGGEGPKHEFLSCADENYLEHLARKSAKVPLSRK